MMSRCHAHVHCSWISTVCSLGSGTCFGTRPANYPFARTDAAVPEELKVDWNTSFFCPELLVWIINKVDTHDRQQFVGGSDQRAR